MAKDVITRFKLETTAFDSAIKNASRELSNYAKTATQAGNDFQKFTKGNVDAARALGNIATSSTNAKDKVKELVGAYNEAAKAYNSLTKQQQQSDFGKALSQSLTQLKGRIGEAKQELNGGGGLSGALDAVAGKFGLNVGQLTKFGGALAAVKGAMELAKGVIESTEATADAYAKAVEVSDNITNQFLRSLATADFSNFINGMQGIIDKTIAAYEAMDEFESYAARFQPWQQAKESEIQTKLMQARAAKAQGDKNRAEQLTNEAKELINQLQTSTRAYGEKQTKGGFSTIRSLMGQVDISDRQIAWYADPKNWDEATRKAEKFARLQEKIQRGNAMSGNAAQHAEARRAQQELDRDPSLRRAYTMMNLRDSGDSKQAQQFRRALGDIYGNTLAESRVESLRARADRMDGILTGGGRSGGSSKTFKAESISSKSLQGEPIGPTESLAELRRLLQEAQQVLTTSTDRFTSEQAEQTIRDLKAKIDLQPLALRLGVSTEEADRLKSKLDESIDSITEDLKPIEITVTTKGAEKLNDVGKETEGTWKDAAGAVGQLGSALQGLEDPSAKVAGIVMQSIANVALSFSKALAESAGPWDWIAASIAGTAAMISTISAIHGATGYAEGGTIPGNSYSGDNQLARVNAGEIILNRAQQSNVANQLENPSQGASGGDRVPYMRNDDIYLGLVTYGRKHGLGDPVFARK
jgi:hypothetical protein